MTAITATITAASPVPNVQIDITIDTPATVTGWTVYRDTAAGSVAVWIGSTSSGAMSLVDYTCPLAVPVTYRLVVTRNPYAQESVSAAPVTITGAVGCFLTDPASGKTLSVNLMEWPERTHRARQTFVDVLNRSDPIGLSDVHATPSGDWLLYTATAAALAALKEVLLTVAGVTVLRTQPTSSIPSVTVVVGEVSERRYTNVGTDQRRLIDVAIQEIAPIPGSASPLPSTLLGLSTVDGSTLGSLSQFRATLLQLSQVPTG